MACIPPNPRRVGYIVPIHVPLDGPLYMSSIYTNTPLQSELPSQRCSRLDKKKVQRANTPPQPQLATGYVEAGAKLRERREGKTLGEYVGKLGGGRDMENPNIADGDPVAHEVQVDLHMLRPLMLDGVSGDIHGADVVAVDERALGERAIELRQKLSEPGRLRHAVSDS